MCVPTVDRKDQLEQMFREMRGRYTHALCEWMPDVDITNTDELTKLITECEDQGRVMVVDVTDLHTDLLIANATGFFNILRILHSGEAGWKFTRGCTFAGVCANPHVESIGSTFGVN